MQKSNVVSVVSNLVTLSHCHTHVTAPQDHIALQFGFTLLNSPPKSDNAKIWKFENLTLWKPDNCDIVTMWRLASSIQCKMLCSAACSAMMGGRWHFDSVWQQNRRHTTSVHCVHQCILYRLVWHFDSVAEEQKTIVYSALTLVYSVTSVTFWQCVTGTQKTHCIDTSHQCMWDRRTEDTLVYTTLPLVTSILWLLWHFESMWHRRHTV